VVVLVEPHAQHHHGAQQGLRAVVVHALARGLVHGTGKVGLHLVGGLREGAAGEEDGGDGGGGGKVGDKAAHAGSPRNPERTSGMTGDPGISARHAGMVSA
jgi:hypothetical protein